MTDEELAERLVFMADVGDMGRKPDPTDTRRLAAAALIATAREAEALRAEIAELKENPNEG